jgi:hypothetical protein
MEALIYKGIVAFLKTRSIASVAQEAWDVPWFRLHEGTGWQKNDRATKKAFKAYATKFTLQGESCSVSNSLLVGFFMFSLLVRTCADAQEQNRASCGGYGSVLAEVAHL